MHIVVTKQEKDNDGPSLSDTRCAGNPFRSLSIFFRFGNSTYIPYYSLFPSKTYTLWRSGIFRRFRLPCD